MADESSNEHHVSLGRNQLNFLPPLSNTTLFASEKDETLLCEIRLSLTLLDKFFSSASILSHLRLKKQHRPFPYFELWVCLHRKKIYGNSTPIWKKYEIFKNLNETFYEIRTHLFFYLPKKIVGRVGLNKNLWKNCINPNVNGFQESPIYLFYCLSIEKFYWNHFYSKTQIKLLVQRRKITKMENCLS